MAQVYMKIMLPGLARPSVHGVLYDATSGRPEETLRIEQGHLNLEMPDGAVFVLVVYGTLDHRPFYCSLTAQVKKGEEIHLPATNGSNVIFDIQGAVRVGYGETCADLPVAPAVPPSRQITSPRSVPPVDR